MQSVRIHETGEIVSLWEFHQRLRRSNVSVPRNANLMTSDMIDAHDADPVFEGPQPIGEPWQTVEPDGIEQDDAGNWRTRWKLVPDVLDDDALNAQRDLKLAALANQRWQVETGGVDVGGMLVKTDEDTQRKIMGAYVQATRNPSMTVRWKVGPGSFMTLDADTIIAIGDAVTAHIQAAFDHESEKADQVIQATTWSELAAIEW